MARPQNNRSKGKSYGEKSGSNKKRPSFNRNESSTSSERGKKTYGDREKSGDDRKKSFGDKPYGDRKKTYGDREKSGDKPYGDKKKSYGDRDKSDDRKKSFGDKPYGDRKKSFGDKPYGDRKKTYGDKPYGDKKKSYGDREKSDDKPYGDRKKSYGDREKSGDDRKKSFGDKPYGDRKKSFGDKPYGDRKKSFGEKDKPYGDRKKSYGDREKSGDKTYGDRKKSYGDREKSDDRKKSFGDKPYGDRKKSFGEKSDSKNPKENDAVNKFVRKKPGFDKKKSYLDNDFKDDDNFDFNEYKEEKKRSVKSAEQYKKQIKKSAKNSIHDKRKDDGSIRLNKFIANTGICSRREADTMIQTGVITVNGKVVTELGTRVTLADKVMFHDQTLNSEKLVYVLLNKPKDYITTSDDPDKRKTVMDLVGNATKERIYPVGRLDRNTTGLLLFTNDGELTKKLTHPKYETKKIYHVMTDKNVKKEHLDAMLSGIELEDGYIKVDDVQFVGDEKNKKDIGVEIHSGRNRIVRRLFEHFDYKVVKLDRVMFAGLTKKDLPRGKWRLLTAKEVTFLKQS